MLFMLSKEDPQSEQSGYDILVESESLASRICPCGLNGL